MSPEVERVKLLAESVGVSFDLLMELAVGDHLNPKQNPNLNPKLTPKLQGGDVKNWLLVALLVMLLQAALSVTPRLEAFSQDKMSMSLVKQMGSKPSDAECFLLKSELEIRGTGKFAREDLAETQETILGADQALPDDMRRIGRAMRACAHVKTYPEHVKREAQEIRQRLYKSTVIEATDAAVYATERAQELEVQAIAIKDDPTKLPDEKAAALRRATEAKMAAADAQSNRTSVEEAAKRQQEVGITETNWNVVLVKLLGWWKRAQVLRELADDQIGLGTLASVASFFTALYFKFFDFLLRNPAKAQQALVRTGLVSSRDAESFIEQIFARVEYYTSQGMSRKDAIAKVKGEFSVPVPQLMDGDSAAAQQGVLALPSAAAQRVLALPSAAAQQGVLALPSAAAQGVLALPSAAAQRVLALPSAAAQQGVPALPFAGVPALPGVLALPSTKSRATRAKSPAARANLKGGGVNSNERALDLFLEMLEEVELSGGAARCSVRQVGATLLVSATALVASVYILIHHGPGALVSIKANAYDPAARAVLAPIWKFFFIHFGEAFEEGGLMYTLFNECVEFFSLNLLTKMTMGDTLKWVYQNFAGLSVISYKTYGLVTYAMQLFGSFIRSVLFSFSVPKAIQSTWSFAREVCETLLNIAREDEEYAMNRGAALIGEELLKAVDAQAAEALPKIAHDLKLPVAVIKQEAQKSAERVLVREERAAVAKPRSPKSRQSPKKRQARKPAAAAAAARAGRAPK